MFLIVVGQNILLTIYTLQAQAVQTPKVRFRFGMLLFRFHSRRVVTDKIFVLKISSEKLKAVLIKVQPGLMYVSAGVSSWFDIILAK